MATSAGVQRVLSKLQTSINSRNYYEAHQMYRTLYFRYLGHKKYSELLNLLLDGSQILLSHEQQASGADLALLLVDVLVQSNTKPDVEWFNKLSRLISRINPDIPEREKIIVNALQWSKIESQNKTGHPQFHQLLAQIFWREKNYPAARHHFLHSADGTGCARMLVELHKEKGFTTEVDLFIAQAVLQFLCLQDKSAANAVFHNYTLQHPDIKTGPPYILPLLNFIWLLLKIIESGKLAAFTVLCEQYQPSLRRDPSYSDYLAKIGQLFFGVAAPRPRAPGFIGNLLQSFLTGLDESGSDEEDTPSASAPTVSNSPRITNPLRTNIQSTPSMDTEELD